MKKGYMTIHGIMGILLILVVFMILFGATPLYYQIISNFGEDTQCQASFIASAMTRTLGKTVIDPKCQTKRITFVVDQKEEGQTETGGEKKAILRDYSSNLPSLPHDTVARVEAWNDIVDDNPEFSDNLKYTYYEDYEDLTDKKELEEEDYITMRYNMDYLMADELQRCWQIVGRGNLPLFDEYWKFIGCRDSEGGPVRECKDADDFWSNVENIRAWKTRPTANFCVLCSRVKFDTELQEKFHEEYESINVWMKVNPYTTSLTGDVSEKSYYEYVIDDSFKGIGAQPYFSYTTDEAQAVVFIRYNWHKGSQFAAGAVQISDNILGKLPFYEGTFDNQIVHYYNSLQIIPYSELSNECNYIVGSYV